MAISARFSLLVPAVLILTASAHAQQPIPDDTAAAFVPLRGKTRDEVDRSESRKLYAMGLLRQRQDRLLDALRLLEEARQLDPEAPALYRALTPLYLALGRHEDAMAACRKVLDREPGDHETWYLYARQLRERGKPKEALEALAKGVACDGVREHLDVLVQMHYDCGTLSEELTEYGKAEAAYTEVIKILIDRRVALLDTGPFQSDQLDREAAKTYEHIGQVRIKAGQPAKAIEAFVAAKKLDPEHAGRLNQNLAEVCVGQNRPAEALTYLDEYLKTQPQAVKPYEMKISLLKQLGRERETLPALKAYAERDPFNVSLQLLLAQQYVREKQWAEAERRFQKLAETPSPEIYRALFDMYKEQARDGDRRPIGKALDLIDETVAAAAPRDDGGRGDAAAATKGRAMLVVLREDNDLVKALLLEAVGNLRNRRERNFSTWRLLGALAARTKQLEAAEVIYRQCLPNITRDSEAEVYGGLLDVLIDARKYEEVVKLATAGLGKAQNSNRLLFQTKLAAAYVRLGKGDEAVAAADEAVKLSEDRNRLLIRRMRVGVLMQLDRFKAAEAECQAMLKEFKEPGEIRDIRYALSSVYSAAKEQAKSEEQLRVILEADPNDATANNDLGYIMADQGKNLEEAEKLIRKAIDLDREEKKNAGAAHPDGTDDNAAYLDSLGWVLFRRGQPKEAREWLEKASVLSGGSDDPVVWDHLGDVYLKLEESARARSAWEKAIQLYELEKRRKADDRYKDVKQKLKTLKQER